MNADRWVSAPALCRGFASYNGPCGDPGCGNCYPGARVCTQCSEMEGECECDNCEDCGELKDRDCKCGTCPCPECDAKFEAAKKNARWTGKSGRSD